MQFAIHDNKRKRAREVFSGAIGRCDWTGLEVKAKVGEIRQYWSYEGQIPVFPDGYENESEWHHAWKTLVVDENCEVTFGINNEHRADIVGNNGVIVEIQKSPIDIRLVRERIEFYRTMSAERMCWLVDATSYFKKTFDIEKTSEINVYKVKWKNKRQWTYLLARTLDCNLFLDINHAKNNLLKTWVYKGEIKCSFYKKTKFYSEYLSQVGIFDAETEEDAILNHLTNLV